MSESPATEMEQVWPEGTRVAFEEAGKRVDQTPPRELAQWIAGLVSEHDAWRLSVINLLGADGVMSRTARRLLDSDIATRAFEGVPGHRDTTTTPARASQWSDHIESTIVALAQRLFRARFVEWRSISTTMSNAIALKALCDVGDTIAVQSMSSGANMSYQQYGVAGVLGLRAVDLPGTELFQIDVDGAARVIRETRPRAIVVGGTKLLFRYPLAELRELADEVGA
jgi:glycine hydroxymethyltransferase